MKMLANGLLLTGLLFAPIAFASACDTGPHRQFDFWVGEWAVSVEGKGQVGHNRIEKIVDGCALRETYTTAGKYHGTSYNSYSPVTGQWHQTWVDNSGLTLLLSGGWNKGGYGAFRARP